MHPYSIHVADGDRKVLQGAPGKPLACCQELPQSGRKAEELEDVAEGTFCNFYGLSDEEGDSLNALP